MLALLRAWAGALLTWLLGMSIMVALTPPTTHGNPIPVSEQALRIHLPWVVICALLVVVAGLLHWRPWPIPRLLLAALPAPALATAIGAVSGFAGATSATAALLYTGEGLAGTALGLVLMHLFVKDDEPVGYFG